MSESKQRSDYLEFIAHKNKLIAHDRASVDGTNRTRKSFFRVNDLDELNAACVNWAHFPCVVHVGHDKIYSQGDTGLPKRVTGNHLYFLSMKNPDMFLADAIEAAYDEADTAMSQYISYMIEDLEEHGVCGNLFLFDMNRATAEQIGPFNLMLYGWHLTFYDKAPAKELVYDEENFFED